MDLPPAALRVRQPLLYVYLTAQSSPALLPSSHASGDKKERKKKTDPRAPLISGRTVSNNIFSWSVPQDWDPTQITRFAQHAASVGSPDFPLFMDLGTRQDGPGYKFYPHAPLAEGACRANLGRWMKTVYYGVETRALANAYPLRRDDGMIAHALHQARQVRTAPLPSSSTPSTLTRHTKTT